MSCVSAVKRAHFSYPDESYLAFCFLKCKVSSGKSYLCPLELSLICPPVRQFQFETTPSFNQLGRNPYDFPTDSAIPTKRHLALSSEHIAVFSAPKDRSTTASPAGFVYQDFQKKQVHRIFTNC
jgi:hypothetical protein